MKYYIIPFDLSGQITQRFYNSLEEIPQVYRQKTNNSIVKASNYINAFKTAVLIRFLELKTS